jgi:hypothetical protein
MKTKVVSIVKLMDELKRVIASLTLRERHVITLRMAGWTFKEIGETMPPTDGHGKPWTSRKEQTIGPGRVRVIAIVALRKLQHPRRRILAELVTDEVELTRLDQVRTIPLEMNLYELELSVRAANCLQNLNLRTVRDLVQCTERDLIETKNFGRKSLREVKELLAMYNLSLGMVVQ